MAEKPAERGRRRQAVERALEVLSHRVAEWAGSSWGFGAALGVIVLWGLPGPLLGFSDRWQLVVNTGTTIVTFLMGAGDARAPQAGQHERAARHRGGQAQTTPPEATRMPHSGSRAPARPLLQASNDGLRTAPHACRARLPGRTVAVAPGRAQPA